MKAWTIVGYTFNADIYCNGNCILRALGELSQEEHDADGMDLISRILPGKFNGAATIEGALKVVATRRNIDSDDERSYDSGDFPKVIFASEEFPDYCPRCALCHGVLDSFDESDYKSDDESEI